MVMLNPISPCFGVCASDALARFKNFSRELLLILFPGEMKMLKKCSRQQKGENSVQEFVEKTQNFSRTCH
jgi:hypothetical protein